MIHNTLAFLAQQVNDHLNRDLNTTSDLVEIGSLKKNDGSLSFESLGMTLIAIDRETTIPYGHNVKEITTNQVIKQKRPLCLNLKVLISSNFDNDYTDALKYLGKVIGFFHSYNVFTHESNPSLSPDIDKLIVDINPDNTDDMYHFWSMAGISYLPSIIYRIRMIVFVSEVTEASPAIKQVSVV